MTRDEHRRLIRSGLAVLVIAVVLGVVYWLTVWRSGVGIPSAEEQLKMRAEIISRLNASPSSQASTETKRAIMQRLSVQPTIELSAERKAEIIQRLNLIN